MKHFICKSIFTIFILFFMNSGLLAGTNKEYKSNSDEILDLVYRTTGINKSICKELRDSIQHNVKQIIFIDSTTPFLSEIISGRKAWSIKIEDIPIELNNGRKLKNINTITTVIDDSTEQILNIVLSSPKGDSGLFRLPTTEEASIQLKVMGEQYTNLPYEQPKISLLEALNQCKHYPIMASEIKVSYVMYSYKNTEPRPVWAIYIRSTRPIAGSGSHIIESYKNSNMRVIVDAVTGERLISINLPYPLLEGGFGYDPQSE